VDREIGGFGTLVVWIDWLVLTEFFRKVSLILEGVVMSIAFVMYFVCFWLCIGYGQLGYGVRQYEVLAIPWECQDWVTVWQTDPRRVHFVSLHVVIFSLGSCYLGYFFVKRLAGKKPADRLRLKGFVGAGLLLPNIAGILCAAILNDHNYLMLGQGACFASYVSGRMGYMDIYVPDWTRKLATWLGLNI
jgi:hypothetical protein